jgi:hypothetical protein
MVVITAASEREHAVGRWGIISTISPIRVVNAFTEGRADTP